MACIGRVCALRALALVFGLVQAAACAGSEEACEGGRCEGAEGEGETDCAGHDVPQWTSERVRYEECAYPERFDQARCADDACVSGNEEILIAAAVHETAAARGYGDRFFLTDVLYDDDGTLMRWSFEWVIITDWSRCAGGGGIDDNAGADPPTPEQVANAMPDAADIPRTVPSIAEVDAALAACGYDVEVLACLGRCDALEVFVIDGEECAQTEVRWADLESGVRCDELAPSANP